MQHPHVAVVMVTLFTVGNNDVSKTDRFTATAANMRHVATILF